ncbi:hypothetical protein [Methylobacillus rhizosphaerae]|uniref:hypothetical protein n=1 Tax=Methylobacillus rhizosphaerae TaxID=551994 RepID=UPI00117ED9EE|nr:hypothetical protein [Methylobacillus rhizosphaerae]
MLHGRFGNAFLNKFATGKLITVQGQDHPRDMGVETAMRTWAKQLGGMTPDQIAYGLGFDYDFPPSCDEFRLRCREYRKPVVFGQAQLLLPKPKATPERKAEHHANYAKLREQLGWGAQ